ncbi:MULTISPECIES: hypothetical protein [unclassified Pseudodesulfovibrio]|uniref:hypothetical protein n=1 Tax=unclassified Pseudodesulfovibrio TaxID=2661612 RepID=UPI000FEB81B7|nr:MULTISPECIES: hypothetical protein [unclassified Pseudodesulfovibrio]MCJ2163032.1 hypothetical protein [Pseudodesulfovibrio sp. S3-i]RWU07026.1 hypothetical protein DWB63_00525 [Pseudodesulfovibrio sp. S3]
MTLPATYYDFIREVRPFVLDLTERDAKDLRRRPEPPTSIQSVDDYDSRFEECVEQVDLGILNYAAQETGYSIEQLRPHLHDALPQMRAEYASLYGIVNQEYHVALNFALAGKKTFHFSDNLAEHLANTEINLKGPLIQLPFPTCLFTFTSRTVVDAMHSINGKENHGLDYSAPISAFLTMLPADEGFVGRKLIICAWHARCPDTSYLMLKRELFLGDDWTLEQALHTDWETLTPDNLGPGISVDIESKEINSEHDDVFYTDGLAFYRIVLNAVLYLSSDEVELIPQDSPRKEMEARLEGLSSKSKRRKLLQRAERHSSLDYNEVGASVGTIVIKKDNAEDGSGPDIPKGKPLVRFMVRGHWRNQPCGPARQDRKLTWIRPYYKGSDLAATINKPYVVK